jgi:hypothetical protein
MAKRKLILTALGKVLEKNKLSIYLLFITYKTEKLI